MLSLNAPFGAWCFLIVQASRSNSTGVESLNAPFGARCFLTLSLTHGVDLLQVS